MPTDQEPKKVQPDEINVRLCNGGGAIVSVRFRHRTIYEEAFAHKGEAAQAVFELYRSDFSMPTTV